MLTRTTQRHEHTDSRQALQLQGKQLPVAILSSAAAKRKKDWGVTMTARERGAAQQNIPCVDVIPPAHSTSIRYSTSKNPVLKGTANGRLDKKREKAQHWACVRYKLYKGTFGAEHAGHHSCWGLTDCLFKVRVRELRSWRDERSDRP